MVVWKLSAVCGSSAGAAQCLSALVLLMGFGGAQEQPGCLLPAERRSLWRQPSLRGDNELCCISPFLLGA